MKVPGYIQEKNQVISFSGNVIKNNSNFPIEKNNLSFSGEETVYLYLEDYKLENITLNFSEESNIKLYVIIHSSTNANLNFMYNLEENVNVDVFTAIRNKGKVKVSLKRQVEVKANSNINIQNAVCNMGITEIVDVVNLNEEFATATIDQLNIGSYNDESVVFQDVNHLAKNTTSNIQNALISNSNAKLKYSVSGTIAKGNEYSSCNQINRGIILKDQGQIEVTPQLFIDEYNVEASHGAAIGQVDEEQLYYLLSRGLSELEARSLIISGYTTPFLAAIEDENIQDFVNRQILKKIKEVDVYVK